MPKFLCLIGMNYGQKRVEPGDIVSDVPKQSIPWLLEQGVIAPADEKAVETVIAETPVEPEQEG